MKQQNKHNDSGDFLENGKFEKMGNWPRIHQRSGKTANEVRDKEGNID